MPTGDLPRSMMCLVDRRLVGSVSPGTRVTAVGILSIFQGKDGERHAWLDGLGGRAPCVDGRGGGLSAMLGGTRLEI